MALTATERQDAIIKARANNFFDEFEGRLSNYGGLQAALDGANMLLPVTQLKNDKKSAKQVTKVPVWTKENATLITARTCEIIGKNPTSAMQSLTYATKGFEITTSISVSDGNIMTEQDQFAIGIKNGLRTALASMDTDAIAKLETSKSGVLVASGLATQASGAYVLESLADTYYDIPSIMNLNDLNGRLVNVSNTEAQKTLLKYESMGSANQVNLKAVLDGTLEHASNFRHYLSNRVPIGANKDVHFIYPEGAFGVFQWNPQDYVQKRKVEGGAKYYTWQDPFLGITWNVKETESCEDLSSTYAGLTDAIVTKYQFTADLAYMTPYSSDSSSPIIKFVNPVPAP